jgi:Holliday junction resolvase RusA-like endonuclease
MITFTIPDEPIPLLRARVVRNKFTNHIHSFTPDKCTAYAEKVRLAAVRAIEAIDAKQNGPVKFMFEKLTGPLELRIDFYRQRPKSAGKKQTWPTTRPDLSNYTKLIEDALNGLIWCDDSQIVVSILRKFYAAGTDEPRTEVRVSELQISNAADVKTDQPLLFANG